MSYRFEATSRLQDAGFVDTFRAVHPDAEVEGRTWSPLPSQRMITPARIDMIFARGSLPVLDAFSIDQRMADHEPGPFYSDHAAVVADLDIG